MSNLLHSFSRDISQIALPKRFTYPFCYQPHKLAKWAAEDLQSFLDRCDHWFYDLHLGPKDYAHPKGKMFGVLVVKDDQGNLSQLWAYSGVVTGGDKHPAFVPMVYDLFAKDAHYIAENKVLESLTEQIDQLSSDTVYLREKLLLQEKEKENEQKLEALKEKHRDQKLQRRRARALQKEQLSTSQFELLSKKDGHLSMQAKFMQKEYAIYLDDQLQHLRDKVRPKTESLETLTAKRKRRSRALQEWIFTKYNFLNANGARKNALEMFKNIPPYFPPSGTGDCAAPKLLQYAYQQKLKPIALAEFWYGAPLKSQVRQHGNFYPACRSKCEPVLKHMLEGLVVDENPLLENPSRSKELEIIYQDEYLLAVHKPADFLSVPGKTITDSVQQRLQERFPKATGPLLVHRLDMGTSGILLVALDKDIHQKLQEQFIQRSVKKQYIALLDGVPEKRSGYIDLPLRVDLDNRPYQLVDPVYGKSARTRYEVIEVKNNRARIRFEPITGRTHQLRVHAAHSDGLNCPIVGDDLYGTPEGRLHLHAAALNFIHPISLQAIHLKIPAPF